MRLRIPFAAFLVVGSLLFAPTASAQLDITSIDPPTGEAGSTLGITIYGGADCVFSAIASQISFEPATGITHTDSVLLASSVISAQITIPDDVQPGLQSVSVTALGSDCFGQDVFEVTCTGCQQARLVSASPQAANFAQTLALTVRGQGTSFDENSELTFSGTGITVDDLTAQDATTLVATITIAAAGINLSGLRDLTVTTGAEVAEGAELFEVLCDDCTQPRLLSVSPGLARVGELVDVTVVAVDTAFDQTSSLSFSEDGIQVDNLVVVDATNLTASLTIAADANEGLRDVTVTTDAEVASGVGLFEVVCDNCSTARIVSVSPDEAYPGTVPQVSITGEGTQFDGSSQVAFAPSGVQVTNLTPISETLLVADLTIEADASLGPRSITVTTGAEQASGADLFAIVEQPLELIPESGLQGQTVPSLTLTGGAGGYTAVTAVDLGEGVAIGGFNAPDDSTLVLSAVNIAIDAPVGRRDLSLSMPGGDRSIPEAFAVLQGAATQLLSISPDHADRGHPGLALELSGENTHFDAQQVELTFSGQGVTATNEQAADATHLSARVRIDTSASEDARDVRVQVGGACDWLMPSACERTELAAAFTVTAPGSLDSADPSELEADGDVDVSISATDGQFVSDNTQLVFEPSDGIEVLSILVTSPDQLVASLRLSADASGVARDVTAVTGTEVAFGQSLVDVHNPQIGSITPAAGFQGTLVRVLIVGIDLPFSAASTVQIDAAGVTVGDVVFDPEYPDRITTGFTIADEAIPGSRQVTVAAGEVSATSVFTVMERPDPSKEGCGCAAEPTGTAWLGLGLLALFGLRFRIARRR